MAEFILYGIILIIAVLGAYSNRSLTFSGSIAAAIVGGAVLVGFGWKGFVALGLFFITSSGWSKYKKKTKHTLEQKHEKGSRRDWQQVLANGGTAAIASILYYYFQQDIWLLMFSISIASSNSDTWASEIGTLSKRPPLFIRTLKRSETGTSGAVSLLGTTAGIAGSFLIAAVICILFQLNSTFFLLIFLFGFLGNVFDTILGAFFQITYVCRVCHSETEKTIHCNQPTKIIRGIKILNNDSVNFLSGFLAAICGFLVYISIL